MSHVVLGMYKYTYYMSKVTWFYICPWKVLISCQSTSMYIRNIPVHFLFYQRSTQYLHSRQPVNHNTDCMLLFVISVYCKDVCPNGVRPDKSSTGQLQIVADAIFFILLFFLFIYLFFFNF